MHVWYAYAALQSLVDFALLQYAETRSLRFSSLVFLAFEDKSLVGLRVRSSVEKGFVLALELGVESKALCQPDFYGFHYKIF